MTADPLTAPDLDDIGYEFRREALLELEGIDTMNGNQDAGYRYRGDGGSKTPEQAAAALATSRQARAAAPAPAIVRGTVLPPAPGPAGPPPALKGAVKVGGFPDQCRYPFAEIAADGGVWRLDPAEWKIAKPESLRTQACAWARKHEITAKTAISDGYVFVQFRKPQ